MSQLSRSELREATLTGLRWVSIARLASEILVFGAAVVLARLIDPADFGRFAVALIVAALALGLTGEGLGSPLVQREDVRRAHLEVATLMSLLIGVAGTSITFGVGSLPFFGEETGELLRLIAPVFLLNAAAVVPTAMLQRRLDFRRLSLSEVVGLAVGTAATLALALAGLDAPALVLGVLVNRFVTLVILLVWAPPPLPRWRPEAGREIASFGTPAAASSLLGVSLKNVDYAIIAAKLGAAQVGFYYRGWQVGLEYQGKVSRIMQRVALPVYSRSQNLEHMGEVRRRIVRVHAAGLFPLLGGMVVVAPELVPWLFGARWEPAVVPAQLLSLAGMFAVATTGMGPLVLAAGHPRALLAWNAGSLAFTFTSLFIAAGYGLTVTCVVVVVNFAIGLFGVQYLLLDRLIGMRMSNLLRDLAPATVSVTVQLALAYPAARALAALDLPTPVFLALSLAFAAAAYVVCLGVFFSSAWADLLLLARRVLRRTPPQADPEQAVGQAPERPGPPAKALP